MSSLNDSLQIKPRLSLLAPCTNVTDDNSNGTTTAATTTTITTTTENNINNSQTDVGNRTELCNTTTSSSSSNNNNNASSEHHDIIKTFHMRKDYRSPTDLYVGAYDPANGIRTACILGSFLLFVTVYIIYKAKCKKNRWTSADKLFIEKYKQKLAEKEFHQRSARRKSFHEVHVRQEIAALEATAKWIQSQPLDAVVVTRKKPRHVSVCNVCLQALDTPSCPTCSKSQSRVSMEAGLPADSTWAGHPNSADKIGPAPSALNSSKDVGQCKNARLARYGPNDGQHRWKNNNVKGPCNLDANDIRKYSNVEYLNLHLDGAGAGDKEAGIDDKCSKPDMAKLLGSRSCESMATEKNWNRARGGEAIPLLQTGQDGRPADRSPPRHQYAVRKSDGCLHPPPHHGSMPTYQAPASSPRLLSPHRAPLEPPSSSSNSQRPSPRPRRSTLSLNLPNALAPDIPHCAPKTRLPPGGGGCQRNNSMALPPAGSENNQTSSWSLPKQNSDSCWPADSGSVALLRTEHRRNESDQGEQTESSVMIGAADSRK